jgi:uncharacterized protein
MTAMFHLSIPVSDLELAREFYTALLGCSLGRVSEKRLDIDFFGHHVVAHLAAREPLQTVARFESAGAAVSVRHFGAIVDAERWHAIVAKLRAADIEFSMAPQVIRADTIEEQHIVMMPDGCGNIVELKSIASDRVFATQASA